MRYSHSVKGTFIGTLSIAALAAFFVSASFAYADSESINFETGYSAGSVNAQNGWSATGAYDQAIVNTSDYGSPAGFGSKALRVSDAVTSGSFGDWVFVAPLTDSVGESSATAGTFSLGTKHNHYEVQFDIAAASTTPQSGLEVSVAPDRGDGSRMSYLRFEDSASGINVFFDDVTDAGPLPTTATFNETQIASGLSRSAPHTIRLDMYTLDGAGNDIVTVSIDGSVMHTGTSWENYYRYDSEASAEQSPRIVKTLIIQARGAANTIDQGYGFLFDNFSLSASDVSTSTVAVDKAWAGAASGTIETASDGNTYVYGINAFSTIQSGVNAVSAGGTLIVDPGVYNENVTISKGIILSGASALNTEINGQVSINAANTTMSGFDVENSNGNFGILINAVGTVDVKNNRVQNVGTGASATQANSYGIYYQSHTTGDVSGITIDTNTINNIGSGITGFSNGGIGIGDSGGSGVLSTVAITGNSITTISSTKGGYGILVNHGAKSGGSTTGLTITGNSIQTLSGSWAHAIGLEGDTPSADVESNTISSVTATGVDAAAVHFEDNAHASSVTLSNNSFDTTSVTYGVTSVVSGAINASHNFWNTASTSPASKTGTTGGAITVAPWYLDAAKTTLSNLASISSFSIGGSAGTIGTNTIDVTVPAGTDLTALAPTITYNGASVSPDTGVSENFSTSPVVYSVASLDGTVTATYNVTVKQAQTIMIDTGAPANAIYGDQITVAAHSDSGLPVSITTSGGCSGTGTASTVVTMTSGTTACTIDFDQAGNGSYAAAPTVTETVAAGKAELTVAGVTADSRIYDGGTDVTIHTGSASILGAVNGDSITPDFTHAIGVFSDKNVGSFKTVTASGITTNADSNNYTLMQPTTKASITAYPLQITAQTDTKTYDGTTNSSVAPSITGGSLQGTDSTGFIQTFASRNVGTGIALTPSGVANDGNSGANYTYSFVPSSAGTINQKAITVQASANSKVYDGTTTAATAPGIIGGLGTGDTANFVETYDNANVGTSKTLTVTGSVNDGNSGNNYSVTFTPGSVGTITSAPLSITANNAVKTYGDALSFAGTEYTSSGLASGDSLTSAQIDSTGTTTASAVGTYPITISNASGTGLGNYAITYHSGTLTVNAKPITVTADNVSKTYGATDPALTYTHGALASGDTDSVFSGSLSRALGENVGTYVISQNTLSAGSNYSISFTPGTFSINPDTSASAWTLATSTSGTTVTGTVPNDTTATTTTGSGTVTLDIPAGTTVTGTSTWDGIVNLPTVSTSYTAPSTSGFTTSVSEAIEIGSATTSLTFSQPVRLAFAGQAGKLVGWSFGGTFTAITNTCDSDATSTTVNGGSAFPAGGDCKISNDGNGNLVVYTKHFTTFLTYAQTAVSTGGGGGGGGNGPIAGGGGGAGPVVGVTTTALPGGNASAGSTGGQVLGAATYNFAHDLTIGSSGTDVTELQKVLIAEGDLSITAPTGYFGALTKAAVVKYQQAHGIAPASGYVGPLTRAQLNKGTTPTMGDEQKALLIQSLQAQLKTLLAEIATLTASSTATTTQSH